MSSKLIFLHIPKTAGSTFHVILNKRFQQRHIKNLFGSRYTEPEIKSFMESSPESRKNIQMLKGHMPFGMHDYLEGDFKYISFLRNPTERVVSQYYYVMKNAKNPLHKKVATTGMSISDFVTSGIAIGMNNGQCRFLNGDIDEYGFGQCDESLYSNVLKHIDENFLWLGLTERFDESVLVLAHLLGWENLPYYIRENTSKIRKSVSQVSAEDIESIEKYNALDNRLYKHANRMLDDHIKTIPDFDEKLLAFTLKNQKLQQRWGWLPDKFRQWIV